MATILALSSHVAAGAVGLRLVVPALEACGHRVTAFPTVILPWHPGHGRATRFALPPGDLAAMLADLAASARADAIDAVITGYFADAAQVEAAAAMISGLRAGARRPVILVDPVIGDAGGLYVAVQTAEAIRDRLVPLADIITPNRHELGWLSGQAVADNPSAVAAARCIGVDSVIVTSADGDAPGEIGNLLVVAGNARRLESHPARSHVPSGTGDLFAAAFLAARMAGRDDISALADATRLVASLIDHAAETADPDLDPARIRQ